MKSTISILFCLLSFSSISQIIDCNVMLKKEIPHHFTFDESDKEIAKDLIELSKCGHDIDSIDLIVLMDLAGSASLKNEEHNAKLNYENLLEGFNTMRGDKASWKNHREMIHKNHVLSNTQFDNDHWIQINQLMAELNFPDSWIERYQGYLINFEGQEILVEDVTEILLMEDYALGRGYKRIEKMQWKYKNFEYQELLKIGKEQNKPIVLYFKQYAEQTIQMEEFVLSDSDVEEKLKTEFIFAPLNLNDKSPIDKANQIDGISFIGDRNKKLKEDLSDSDLHQMTFLFLILNSDGVTLKEFLYTNEKQKFITFLNEGLSQFKN